jgi:CubicO group peptidase (beta-lactamase class C family)
MMRFSTRFTLLAAALCLAQASHAQTPQLPAPDSTDPVKLELMAGFPPPPDKQIRLATVLKYPNSRWAFHHMRELGPTASVRRGAGAATALKAAPRDLDGMTFQDPQGASISFADWQGSTYTDGLLVLHKGKVVYERTFAGMDAAQPHALWSMSKSFTGLLASMLIHEGVIKPDALITSYLPELAGTAWADATVQQTLDMTTGVQYREDFADPTSGVIRYLIASGLLLAPATYAGPRTTTDFIKTVKKEGEHGAGFQYKSVDTEVIAWMLQRVTGKSYADLVSERIWSRLGMQEDAYVWVDGIGTQLGSVGLNATMRDLGRFGEMMRSNGRKDGQQIVPEAVVRDIRAGASAEKFEAANMPMRKGYSYHNHWWITHDADGTFEAKGLYGQHIHINPAAELVIVKLSSHPVGNTAFTHVLDRSAFAAVANRLRVK